MPDSAFSAAPIMAPALPPINTPVYTTVGAFALDPAGVATADLARQQQANKDALAQQQAVATAALNASNAAAAAELADAKAAAAKAAVIPMSGQSEPYAPGTAPGTVGSLKSTDPAETDGLLSPAGQDNLAAKVNGSSSPAPTSSTPTIETPTITPALPNETTLPDMIDLTPQSPAIANTPIASTGGGGGSNDTAIMLQDQPNTTVSSTVQAPPIQLPAQAPPVQTPSVQLSFDEPVTSTVVTPSVSATSSSSSSSTNNSSSKSDYALDGTGHLTQGGVAIAGGGGTSNLKIVNDTPWAQDARTGQWFTVQNGQFQAQGNLTPDGETKTAVQTLDNTDKTFGLAPVTPTDSGVQAVMSSKTSMTPTADNPDPLHGYQSATTTQTQQPTTGSVNPDETPDTIAANAGGSNTSSSKPNFTATGDGTNEAVQPLATVTYNPTPYQAPSAGPTPVQTFVNNVGKTMGVTGDDNSSNNGTNAYAGKENPNVIGTVASYDPNTGQTSKENLAPYTGYPQSYGSDVVATGKTAVTLAGLAARVAAKVTPPSTAAAIGAQTVGSSLTSINKVLIDAANGMGIGPAQGRASYDATIIQQGMSEAQDNPIPKGTRFGVDPLNLTPQMSMFGPHG
jgi:hypothetical protein